MVNVKGTVAVPVLYRRRWSCGCGLESASHSSNLLGARRDWKIREKVMHAVGRRRGEKENEQRSDA
jgi:hypothetical protein